MAPYELAFAGSYRKMKALLQLLELVRCLLMKIDVLVVMG
jgi:hypothetical protein